jgi:hypothetical protein
LPQALVEDRYQFGALAGHIKVSGPIDGDRDGAGETEYFLTRFWRVPGDDVCEGIDVDGGRPVAPA